jgi:predicted dehydrogenase
MPEPKPDDPRWSLELAGGAVMDLGCYGLHVHRQLGRFAGGAPSVVAARAVERTTGVDESMDIDLVFPNGATGSSINSMNWDRFEMTLRLVGDRGQALAHDYMLQYGDDRITVSTDAGTTTLHVGTRSTYTYQLEVFADHLLGGTPFPIDTDDAVTNMRFVDAAYIAAGLPPR